MRIHTIQNDSTILSGERRKGDLLRNPVSLQDAVQRLEPCAGKLARTVLRGGCTGNRASLPYGKARKPNEFGCKVSVMTTADEGFVLCSHAMHGNPYDGHTVNNSLLKMNKVAGEVPRAVLADRGYMGADRSCLFSHVHITGRKRGKGKAHEQQHRRNSIEPIIGHMKNEGWMHRNWLKGEMGDKINAALCGAGQNLRMVLRKLRELLFGRIFGPLAAVITGIIDQIRMLLQRQEMTLAA